MTSKKHFFLPKSVLMGLCWLLFFYGPLIVAQVGIASTLPKSQLDINGALSLNEGPQITLVENNNNDISLGTAPYSFYKLTGPTNAFYITGIVPLTGANGQIVVLQNTSSAIMFISHNSTSSVAANRIYVPSGKDLMVRGLNASITLRYNASLAKWVLLDKLNHVETWYSGVLVIPDGLTTTLTVTSPGVTPTSSIAITLVGFYSTPVADKYNISIEYVEAQTNQFIFRMNNTNPDTDPRPPFNSAVSLQYSYTIVK